MPKIQVEIGGVTGAILKTSPLKVGSLYSGIGGWDLGFTTAGWDVAWQCEQAPYRRAILKRYWPSVPCFEDGTDPAWTAPAVDCLVAACPTQLFLDKSPVHEAVWRRVGEAAPTWVVIETTLHPEDIMYAGRCLEALGYQSLVMPAIYGQAAVGVKWIRVLLVARRINKRGTARAWRAMIGAGMVGGELNPGERSGIAYGGVERLTQDDTAAALALAVAMGYPAGWLLDGPPTTVTQAVVDTTAVPIARQLAVTLARPAWR